MKSIDPSCKFIGILLPALALAVSFDPALDLGVTVACLIAAFSLRVSPRKIALVMSPAALLAAGMFFTALRYSSETLVGAHRGMFSDSGLYNGMLLASRLLAFASLGMIFVTTTNPNDFVRSLCERLRLPRRFAYGLLAAWGLFPLMTAAYRRSRLAFRARGVRVFAFSPALLLPLLVKCAQWSEALAIAMESKGFDDTAPRTTYGERALVFSDILFPILTTAAVCLAAMILRR